MRRNTIYSDTPDVEVTREVNGTGKFRPYDPRNPSDERRGPGLLSSPVDGSMTPIVKGQIFVTLEGFDEDETSTCKGPVCPDKTLVIELTRFLDVRKGICY